MSGLRIETACPQCGAPTDLEETERLVTCPFCRVKSFLVGRDGFRYLLPSKSTRRQDLLYVPYWRFKGLFFACRQAGVEHRFADVNEIALALSSLPRTLGLRPQGLRLRFLTPQAEGRFLPPERSLGDAMTAFLSRLRKPHERPLLCTAHIGESMGLLYAPYGIDGPFLLDAVLDRPLSIRTPPELLSLPVDDLRPAAGVTFLPALCPDCGWDLEGSPQALALHCRSCQSSWIPSDERLTQVSSCCATGGDPGSFFLPFWEIGCELRGIELRTRGELARAANLPAAPRKEWEEEPFRFWVPAFKIRAENFLQLAKALTLHPLTGRLEPSLPGPRHHPVTLPVEEACESLKLILAAFLRPRRDLPERLAAVEIRPERFRLAYLPFRETAHDWIQPEAKIAVNRNILGLSANL